VCVVICGAAAPTVRVRLVIQLAATPIGYVRVQLGGREVGVAEHLLHTAEVRAAFEEMGREGMAQQMRMDARRLETGLFGAAAQDQECARPCERSALGVQEELGAVAPVEVGASAREVAA
jgi:hypothetical protein